MRAISSRLVELRQSVLQALRAIRHTPGLAAGVVLAFALGVGANVVTFRIVDRLLLSPPAHVASPDDVRRLLVDQYVSSAGRRVTGGSVMLEDYEQQRHNSQVVEVAAYASRSTVTLGRGVGAERVPSQLVTATFWRVLGVNPASGRFFMDDEDRPGAAGTAVISHALWQRRFAGEPAVLGRTVDFGGYGKYTIIGVAPAGFTGVGLAPVDVWLPAIQANAPQIPPECCYYWLNLVARVQPGASIAAVEAEATVRYLAGQDRRGERAQAPKPRIVAAPLILARGPNRPAVVDVALWLSAVSALVLLIACVNVTNLLVARAIRARGQTAVRLALGMTRARLALDTLVETMLLALAGGAGALLVAHWGGRLVQSILLPGVVWPSGFDLRTIALWLVVTLLAGLAASLFPLIEAGRRDAADLLRASQGRITRSAARARTLLCLGQATLCTVLLVGAGLFVRSLRHVRALDLGFDPQRLLLATPQADPGTLDAAARARFFENALAMLAERPGVRAAAAAAEFPFGNSSAVTVSIRGVDSLPRLSTGGPYINVVTHDYFATMDLRILRGRGFEETDVWGAEPVAVINQTFARLAWPQGDPDAGLGRCLIIGADAPCTTIVGVVENARRDAVIEEPTAMYYVLFDQRAASWDWVALLVRVEGNASDQAPDVRRALLALEPRLRDVEVRAFERLMEGELRSWTLGAAMFTALGALGLLVAASGLYSLLAFDVAQRTREIGLRSALGASACSLIGLVVGRAVKITGGGIVLGFAVALVLGRRMRHLLYGVAPDDPLTASAVGALLLVVAAVASWAPALRAVRVDPNVALRAE